MSSGKAEYEFEQITLGTEGDFDFTVRFEWDEVGFDENGDPEKTEETVLLLFAAKWEDGKDDPVTLTEEERDALLARHKDAIMQEVQDHMEGLAEDAAERAQERRFGC